MYEKRYTFVIQMEVEDELVLAEIDDLFLHALEGVEDLRERQSQSFSIDSHEAKEEINDHSRNH